MKNEEAAIPHFLERVIGSIRELTDEAATSFEILFVDDGSPDGTLELLEQANAADPRVRALSLSRNFGNRNQAAATLCRS